MSKNLEFGLIQDKMISKLLSFKNKIKNVEKAIVFHSFLFALFPVLNSLANNIDSFPITAAIRSILLMLLSAYILIWIFNKLLLDPHKSGIFASFSIIFLYYLGSSFTLPSKIYFFGSSISRSFLIIGVWGILLFVFTNRWVWDRVRPSNLTRYFNYISIVPLINPIRIIILFFVILRQDPLFNWDNPMDDSIEYIPAKVEYTPDIYYIILDGYARQDILMDIYQFDNSKFIQFLDQKGFFVAQRSQSNYIQTGLSVGSSLNMEYLDFLEGVQSTNRYPLRDLIRDSRVRMLLSQLGYSIVNIESEYLLTDHNNADIYQKIGNPYLNEFEKLTLFTSVFKYVEDLGFDYFDIYGYSSHRNAVLSQFQLLKQIPQISGPKFIFCHIVAPHPPFVFDEKGASTNPDRDYTISDGSHYKGTRGEYLIGYSKQIQYINSLLMDMIETILNGSNTPPIIILQSDHGPGSYLDWKSVDNTCLKERVSILNAYYFPNQETNLLYASISPVNSFRVVFDTFFSTHYGLLPDNSYYSSWNSPYEFIDVNSHITDACDQVVNP